MALIATGLRTQIMNNHLKSALLLAAFPALLLLMIFAFCAGLEAMMQSQLPARGAGVDWQAAWRAGAAGVRDFGPYAVGAALAWFAVAYFLHGRMMRAATGAVPVTRRDMPRIYNLLENLCIAHGIPMPRFEVIDSPALNAFATGLDRKSYRIVLTRGIIEKLDDEELEAVIAHELTHIMNRDVRLLIVSAVFVGIISFLAQALLRMLIYGRRPNYYRPRRGRGGGGAAMIAVMALALLVVMIGKLFALVIRFALSRKREYLADAGAVEMTRNPQAMMRALMRIRGNDAVKGMPRHIARMCIEDAGSSLIGLFATHPPIDARIRAISRMTGTPVPDLPVTLRRAPARPWGEGPGPRGPWG